MKKYTRLISLLLALGMMFALCACGGETPPVDSQSPSESQSADPAPTKEVVIEATGDKVEKKTPAGQLVVGYNSEPETLDPAEAARGGPTINNIIYEPLVYMNYEKGEMEPWLATEWYYEDDVTLVVKLRDDVKFSNGDPMVSEDVLYTIYRYATSAKYGASYNFIDYENSYAEDDHTVVIKLHNPSGPAISYLCTMYVYNKSFCEEVGVDALATQTCGTGPYVQVSWTANYAFEYARNEHYWGGHDVEVEFDSILLRYYSEETTMEVDFETGAIDMAVNISDTMAESIINGELEGASLSMAPSLGVYAIAMYDQYEPFKDARVRKAIAHAVDWDAVREVALGVTGKAIDSSLADGILYKVSAGTYEYDPDLARQLLAEAGYENGFEFLLVPTTGNFYTLVCETIQFYLAEVGVTMNFEQYDFSTAITYWQGTQNNGIPVNQAGVLSSSASNADPDKLYTTIKVGSGLTYVECNDDYVQELLNTGATSTDETVRAEAYAKLQEYIYEQCYQIPFAQTLNCYVAWNYIDNLDTAAPSMPRFCFTTLAE